MQRKFKITFITPQGRKKEVVLEATSKYDAKLRFYRTYPNYEVITIKEITGDEQS